MWAFIVRRVLIMIPMMFLVSIICFTVTELQPGDFATQYLNNPRVSPEQVFELKKRLGLDKPASERYLLWMKNILTKGDFGYSFAFKRPVGELIWERMGWTILIALSVVLFQWIIAIPIGIYSARHSNSFMDHALTIFVYFGISVPTFFLALIIMYLALQAGADSIGGLFSPDMIGKPWSIAKIIDLLEHLWLPLIVVGISGLANFMRIMRGSMLDVINAPFISSIKARGLTDRKVRKHTVKNAINPLISIAGMQLPQIFSGTIIVAIVLNLPTMGPFFYKALLNHDQYLVMSFLMFIALITLIGNLLSDIALALHDPRIRIS
jgi:peptide/nickel transport system permease protein